jgi:sigma-E factor negative regulatory protein RseB
MLLALAGTAFAQETPREWLEAMTRAVQSLNYDGTFVYLHDGRLEAMRIVHAVDENGVRERLASLTGSAREVLRNNEAVTCIMPDSKSVMVGQSRSQQPFRSVPRELDALERHYRIEHAGEDRIAGYTTRIVAITPGDEYRYGYRFWIDTDSKMFLRSDLVVNDATPVEQVMFTRLTIGDPIPDTALQPSLNGDDYTWIRQEANQQSTPAARREAPGWTVTRLPAGFELTDYQRQPMRPDQGETEHMVFSDGLATVSVYVESAEGRDDTFNGQSSMGAMNAYSHTLDGHLVTVVGEVPAVTVEMMARSVAANGVARP